MASSDSQRQHRNFSLNMRGVHKANKSGGEKDVPDPYYGNSNDFEYALDLIESGCDALVKKVKDWS